MRELKFRAWLEGKHDNMRVSEAHMEYGVTLSESGFYLSVESGWDIQGEYKTIPIMQYIGLKDKNNVAIYEDDILKVNFYDKESGDKMDFIGIVCWDEFNLQFRVGNEDEVYEIWNDTDLWTFEVLGNIYENEDLLNNN